MAQCFNDAVETKRNRDQAVMVLHTKHCKYCGPQCMQWKRKKNILSIWF